MNRQNPQYQLYMAKKYVLKKVYNNRVCIIYSSIDNNEIRGLVVQFWTVPIQND
jgi:hypothetical protein